MHCEPDIPAQAESPFNQKLVSKMNFTVSPITPGFWQFSNKKNANTNEISKGCREYVTFQFQDGYYFTLSMKKHPPEAEPRLNRQLSKSGSLHV